MTLAPEEAVVLIIRRSKTNPSKRFVAVRKSESYFDQSHNFYLEGNQETVTELGRELEFSVALERAVAAIREMQP